MRCGKAICVLELGCTILLRSVHKGFDTINPLVDMKSLKSTNFLQDYAILKAPALRMLPC